ncbi:MAG: ROK family protein [Phycisphaerae bacterium]|nr:ROK family protein [Phycisphaerae bacterium]
MTEADGLAIALEIGGSKLQAALGTSEGEIISVRRGAAPAEHGAQAILGWFLEGVPPLLEQARADGRRVAGIGVGFGGPVDSATGRALVSHQVAGWENVSLKTWFEERFGLPVTVANDSNAAGWAEYCRGAGRGTRHFCYMNIGSGIGGALVIDGRLHDGQGLGAGEIGHTYVPDWTASEPGSADKLEHLCSGWSIEARLGNMSSLPEGTPLAALCGGDPKRITCAALGEAAERGDGLALMAIDQVAGSVGLALANVVTLFHPERIALGGGVSLMGEVLLEPVRRAVAARVFGPFKGRYEIVPCALGESVVLVGALLLAPR